MSETSSKTRPLFGGFALAFALAALAISIMPSWMDSVNELDEKTLSEKFSESMAKTKENVIDKFKGEEKPVEKKPLEIDQIAEVAGMAMGFIAVVMGIIAYVRREDLRLSATAAVIGVTAIAWHDLFAAIALGIMLIVIGIVVRGLSHAPTAQN